jgi:bacterioferritin-associated ferredoxin
MNRVGLRCKLDYNCMMAEFIEKENGITPDEFDRAVARGVESVKALDRMVGKGRLGVCQAKCEIAMRWSLGRREK